MPYRYTPDEDEKAARALLRSKGWRLSEPDCRLCRGWGSVFVQIAPGVSVAQPCPNGCANAELPMDIEAAG